MNYSEPKNSIITVYLQHIMIILVGVQGVSGETIYIQGISDIDRLLISRSSVRSRDGPPFKTMGCQTFLVAHFCLWLALGRAFAPDLTPSSPTLCLYPPTGIK